MRAGFGEITGSTVSGVATISGGDSSAVSGTGSGTVGGTTVGEGIAGGGPGPGQGVSTFQGDVTMDNRMGRVQSGKGVFICVFILIVFGCSY